MNVAQFQAMKAQLAALEARIEALEGQEIPQNQDLSADRQSENPTSTIKRGPGRPRKTEVEAA